MKPVTKLLIAATLAAAPFITTAQTVESTANDIKWSLMPNWTRPQALIATTYNSSGSSYSEGRSTGIIKIDDKSIISPVQLDKNNYGVIRLNSDLSTQWLTNFDGFPMAIGMFHNKVLVICTASVSMLKGASNNYIGYLIDPKTGSILLQKNFYNEGEEFYEQPVFLISPDGSFFKMALRTSTLTKKLHFSLAFSQNKAAQAYFDTGDFKILEFDDNLAIKGTLKPVLEQGYFIGATINKNGDVFLLYDYNQGYINLTRYENGKSTPAKTLQLPVSMSDNEIGNVLNNYLFTSKSDPLSVFFASSYSNVDNDREIVVAKYNFKDGTVANNIQVMDKPYMKDLAKSYVPFSKKFDDVDMGERQTVTIKNVLENDGRLILSLSAHDTKTGNPSVGTHTVYIARDLLINIYDAKTNLQFQQIIPRKYSSFGIGFFTGAGMHCKNDQLYITLNNNKGVSGTKGLFSQIDLKTGAITNMDYIDKKDIKNAYSIDPDASLWFDNKVVISYIQEKGLNAGSEDAHLQLVDF